jgi:hypothetical protein
VPRGTYEIVGYLKEAVKRKDAAGNWKIIEPEEFIEGEMKPHQSPGVGFGEMVMKDGSRRSTPRSGPAPDQGSGGRSQVRRFAKKIAERADDIAA